MTTSLGDGHDVILDAALAHAAKGRPVFPCGANKAPLTPSGFKDATTDPEQIRGWWERWPGALIGMPTGATSHVFVLDVDNDPKTGKDGDGSLSELIRLHAPLPDTVESLTPRGGRHLFFVHPGGTVPNSASKLAPHIDIRGDGGYVILAPSILPDGRRYQWEGSSDPDEGVRAVEAPGWLRDLVVEQSRPVAVSTKSPSNKIPQGRRNDELFRLGRSLRAKGLTEAAIGAALQAENSARCDPPLPEPEVSRITSSAASKTAGQSPEFARSRRQHQEPASTPPPITAADEWPEPGEIATAPDREPYPVDCFPNSARKAITEYQQYGKQPMAMVAGAALGQMALAGQALSDVGRDAVLKGPCSLNILIVGRSGERKTGADSAFGRGAREWEREQRELRMPDHRKAKALIQTNNERRQSVQKKLGQLAVKRSTDAETERKELERRRDELEEQAVTLKPYPLPHLFYEDATSQGLALHVATNYPTAALMSDEAGIVLGGSGMSDDNALGLLTLLNRLWDGRSFRPTRAQAKTAEIRGRRFTCSLMLQQELLEKITQKGGRGVGFFGRYLMAAPLSTMGERRYTSPPADMPALAAFHARTKDLLDMDLPVNDDFQLVPPVMTANRAALELWRDYHDAVETELHRFGEFSQITDIGAKSAENAARIACVFQIWDQGPEDVLRPEYVQAGITVAAWHLNEASRIFFEADKPEEIQDAELLSEWLTTAAPDLRRANGQPLLQEGRMPIGEILRQGPYRLRDKARRDPAIRELSPESMDGFHLRIIEKGKRKELIANPNLLKLQ